MREIRARFSVPDVDLHPWAEAYDAGDVWPILVYRMEVLADGTATIVAHFRGDPDRVSRELSADDDVIDATVTTADDGLIHYHFEPSPLVREMIDARRETSLSMQMPLRLNEDGSVSGTFYGDETTFSESLSYLPGAVAVEIERISDVTSAERSPFGGLTERQREVLDAAVEAGYYDDPRGATHAELAETLGVSPTTVSEHLRRIERHVFATYQLTY